MKHTRREFLVSSGCLGLSGAAYAASFNQLSLLNLFAQSNVNDTTYKALVCIFMFGGSDANNMLIPYDGFAPYQDARGNAPFFIPQGDLLQINGPDGATFGLAYRSATVYNLTPLQSLYNQGKLAFVCNVGTLAQPLTRDDYQMRPDLRPNQLFSHSDQQSENQTGVPQGTSQTGWGGRLADVVRITGEAFPLQISVAGVTIYTAANIERPLVVPSTGPLTQALRFDLPRPETLDAVNALLGLSDASRLRNASSNFAQQAIGTRERLDSEPGITATFPNTSLGNQLKQIAKFIALRDVLSTGSQRQIFFASLGGFDTHSNQLGNATTGQGGLLTQVSAAMAAFNTEMEAQGVQNQVTTFTLSDFSRTFKIGNQASGTDHAWGSHLMVMGGAVKGGNFYGTYPTLALDGPDDVDTGVNARGRWLPTTSLAQYGATLAKWFGVSDAQMPDVFRNIGQFSPTDLGFMNS